MNINYDLPNPIVDKKETDSLEKLTEKYMKMLEPSITTKAAKKVGTLIPDKVKNAVGTIGNKITEQELYQQALKLISSGFKVVEEQVSKYTISESMVLKNISKSNPKHPISYLDEVCLVRSYDIAKLVSRNKGMSRFYAVVEGGVTGVVGFGGLPFNLVFSTLLYFRAVQAIAMYYGYDVKNDDEELVIASDVFANALSPTKNDVNNELGGVISKIMIMTEANIVKQTAKKTWTDMAARGGVPLLLTQMRALAHKAAQKALEKAGAKGLEQSLFKGVFEQIGKKLTLKTVGKAVPVVSGVLGALIDVAQMNQIVRFADIFYQKRFIMEKQGRIERLIETTDVIDIEFTEE
ncbi:MAG: EcsC family protein [Ruminococcus sp.]|nr:EcsC family protein [Ruminococcus sp.]